MVKVQIKRNHHDIKELLIQGHADFAPHGQDLVCAAVSSIAIGMMNALDQMAPDICLFDMREAYIKITCKQCDYDVSILLEGMTYQLKTLEESYQSYIKINDQEV